MLIPATLVFAERAVMYVMKAKGPRMWRWTGFRGAIHEVREEVKAGVG